MSLEAFRAVDAAYATYITIALHFITAMFFGRFIDEESRIDACNRTNLYRPRSGGQ
jgi:hypothetical protein